MSRRSGVSLPELLMVMAVTAALLAVGAPRLGGALDRMRVDRATLDVTTALAATRHAAIALGTRARLGIAADSLRIDTLGTPGWGPFRRFAGPAGHGVALEVSNREVGFGATGVGWGASNTRIVLRRGVHSETVTTSRLGRVKRW